MSQSNNNDTMSDNNAQFNPADIALYIQQQITASTEPLVHQVQELQHQLTAANTLLAQHADPPAQHVAQQVIPVHRVKAVRPKEFSASYNEDPSVWLFKFDQWATIEQLNDTQKLLHAPSLLDGKAAVWYRGLVRTNTAPTSWVSFYDALLKMFKPVNSVKSARDKLHNLRQVSSVLKYNYEFTQLLLEINDMGAADQLDYYVRGLKQQVRLQVELHQPTTLQQAMEQAQVVDNITYHNRIVPQYGYTRSESRTHTSSDAMDTSAAINEIESDTVSAINRGQGKPSPSTRSPAVEYCLKHRLCIRCKQPGHIALNCKNPYKQLNLRAQ